MLLPTMENGGSKTLTIIIDVINISIIGDVEPLCWQVKLDMEHRIAVAKSSKLMKIKLGTKFASRGLLS